VKRVDQPSGDLRNVTHGVIECGLIGMGRLCKSADLADKLKRGSLNLRVGCGRLEIKKWSDVSTHTYNDGAPTAMSRERYSPPEPIVESLLAELAIHCPLDAHASTIHLAVARFEV